MSEVVCYIERAERGMLPLRLRLLSPRREDSWSFPDVLADDRAALQRGLAEAAEWVARTLQAFGRSRLGALVLDSDGSLCSWVSTPSPDPDAIDAMLRHAGSSGPEEDAAHAAGSPPHLALSSDLQTPGGASVQPLGVEPEPRQGLLLRRAQPGPQTRQRLGVAVVPDATVRLLLDELDRRAVSIGRTVTVWHALAEAFGAGDGASRADRVVSDASATIAAVVADPHAGRLAWVWSRNGAPVAAGAFRLARAGAGEQVRTRLERADLARLASEWIAWSTQLGASPTRVRFLAPPDAWSDDASMGECVAAVWPGATTDISFDDDPLGAALVRFSESLDDGGAGAAPAGAIAALQARPGRQHRAMYRWSAVAVALAAGAMGVAAFLVHQSAQQAMAKAGEARAAWRATAAEILPSLNDQLQSSPAYDSRAVLDLQTELEERRRQVAPVQVAPEKPVLAELETLSYVLSNSDYRLERLDISSSAVIIDVTVPDTAAYEELVEALSRIGGSAVGQWDRNPRPVSGSPAIRAQFTGLWAVPARPGGST